MLALLIFVIALPLHMTTQTQAEDLPIDITAITRQETRETHITTRIGASLFTSDAERVNAALEGRVYQRQAISGYLFANVLVNYEVNPHEQVVIAANNAALFAQPSSFTGVTLTPPTEELPIWVMLSVIAICAIGGFIGAMLYVKKKGMRESVH